MHVSSWHAHHGGLYVGGQDHTSRQDREVVPFCAGVKAEKGTSSRCARAAAIGDSAVRLAAALFSASRRAETVVTAALDNRVVKRAAHATAGGRHNAAAMLLPSPWAVTSVLWYCTVLCL